MTTFSEAVKGVPRASFGVTLGWAVAFLLVHVPLGLAFRSYPVISTVHALFVLALGIGWALSGKEKRVAVWGAYVVASDVLWKMTRASIPWEFAKYALVLVFGLAILRSGRLRGPSLPFVYMGLLFPSALLVVLDLGPQVAFDGISFNLSGPLSLAVGVWFFSRLTLRTSDYAALLIAMMGPIVSIGTLALSGTLSAEAIRFKHASNFATSGGYGPNQVSSVLGLGAMAAILLFLMTRRGRWFRAINFSLMVGFACLCALTFSRGGLYTAAGAMVAALPFLVRDRGARRRLILGGTVTLALAVFLVLPGLESFTGGALGARFGDIETTGRDRIALADLEIWKENPIFGVGAGRGPASRLALMGAAPAAHTEWSRLVAEHGLLGFGAAVCLIAMAWRAVGSDRRPFVKALAVAFSVWAFLYMLHAGMRLAAPGFAIGLAQCRVGRSSGQPEARTSMTDPVQEPAAGCVGSPGVLVVGSFPGTAALERYVSGGLAVRLASRGWRVLTTSRAESRLRRPWNMIGTVFHERSRYDVALVDVFSGPAFLWAETVALSLRAVQKAVRAGSPRR